MSRITRLQPINRHLLVVPHTKNQETQTGVLLPEDYELPEERYVEATVIDVSKDCNPELARLRWGKIQEEKRIIIDRSMIQEITINEKTHFLILENYVVGIFRGANED